MISDRNLSIIIIQCNLIFRIFTLTPKKQTPLRKVPGAVDGGGSDIR